MQDDIKNVNHTKNFAGNAAAAFLLFVYMSEDLTLIFYISKTDQFLLTTPSEECKNKSQ
jgi:hypothetical protein